MEFQPNRPLNKRANFVRSNAFFVTKRIIPKIKGTRLARLNLKPSKRGSTRLRITVLPATSKRLGVKVTTQTNRAHQWEPLFLSTKRFNEDGLDRAASSRQVLQLDGSSGTRKLLASQSFRLSILPTDVTLLCFIQVIILKLHSFSALRKTQENHRANEKRSKISKHYAAQKKSQLELKFMNCTEIKIHSHPRLTFKNSIPIWLSNFSKIVNNDSNWKKKILFSPRSNDVKKKR